MKDKETSVEWLKQQFDFWGDRVWEHQNDLFQQAKAMEKEQILDACHHGVDYDKSPYKNAEEYYNETYKQEDDGE